VLGTNPKYTRLLRINPFRFPDGIDVLEHLDRLVEMFNVCWPMYAAMPAILKEAIVRAYEAAGWNLRTSTNKYGEIYPVFKDVLEQIKLVVTESDYSNDSKGDYKGALITRVNSLTTGLNHSIFTTDETPDDELFEKNTIVDLSRIGSVETKSLIIGLLVMRLQEYRMSNKKSSNSELRHITVLEEAHSLLKRTSTEQSQENANLLGQSVEMLANSIAEMRTYGEGFIIADQSPGLLDMSVIRNTNTKIILRLLEYGDRTLTGRAASLNEKQIDELAKLERGVAAVYQNDWVEPVLVKINRCKIDEKPYKVMEEEDFATDRENARAAVYILLKGRVQEKLDVDTDQIERAITRLNAPAESRIMLSELLAEYRTNGKIHAWLDEHHVYLSKIVTDIFNCRSLVEREVRSALNNTILTDKLITLVQETLGSVGSNVEITAVQCLLRDFSARHDGIGRSEREIRERIYCSWVEYIKGKGDV
jgi:hypothetical protein